MDKTFIKGLVLLEAMARNDKGSGVSELAAQLLLNKSNVHRLLQALVHQGFARKNAETNRYELTMKMWELGSRIAGKLDVRLESLPFMKQLAEETRETVHLSILDGAEVLYIEKIDSPQPVRAYTTVGGRAPAQCVATGKALLAWADEEVLANVKNRLKAHTGKSIVRLGDLRRQLEEIRTTGYAINTGEWREQVVGAAAPIRDASGRVVAALGISGPAERLDLQALRQGGKRLIEATQAISLRLGYSRT
ncbi:IclR family transcriptional regulator [Diaphorobacter ruginosibacter]|uniref:IclR family transcriptional regulator n=1 Tax=Diaphorobacter ruginosibacter TaxID=1715720 RepID=UPI00333E7710